MSFAEVRFPPCGWFMELCDVRESADRLAACLRQARRMPARVTPALAGGERLNENGPRRIRRGLDFRSVGRLSEHTVTAKPNIGLWYIVVRRRRQRDIPRILC